MTDGRTDGQTDRRTDGRRELQWLKRAESSSCFRAQKLNAATKARQYNIVGSAFPSDSWDLVFSLFLLNFNSITQSVFLCILSFKLSEQEWPRFALKSRTL